MLTKEETRRDLSKGQKSPNDGFFEKYLVCGVMHLLSEDEDDGSVVLR